MIVPVHVVEWDDHAQGFGPIRRLLRASDFEARLRALEERQPS
jgi:hypothetical protein